MRICHLQEKDVVDVCSCRYLGRIMDVDIDECNGCVRAIIVPGPCKCFGFLKPDFEHVIPWCNIKCIGPDVILVELRDNKPKVDKK